MSNAWWVYGSELKIGNDGTGTELFTKVAEIKDISGPRMTRDAIEVTSHDSTGGWREFIPGMKDAGEVSVEANWIPSHATQSDGSKGILAKFKDNKVHNFQIITANDGSNKKLKIAFAGIVTSFEVDLPMEEQGKLNFALKLTGKPVMTHI